MQTAFSTLKKAEAKSQEASSHLYREIMQQEKKEKTE